MKRWWWLIGGLGLVVVGGGLLLARWASDSLTSGPSTARSRSVDQESGEVVRTGSTYRVASARPTGRFQTGQAADVLLSGVGFNQTGGPLLFNHPSGLATDGTQLFLADTYNNRILVWNQPPTSNTPPDLVLGQANFTTNATSREPTGLNWPISLAVGGGKLVATDTFNDRILVWTLPIRSNGQAPELVLESAAGAPSQPGPASGSGQPPVRREIKWPWGVWTDGRRLAVASTGAGVVMIWNEFPTDPHEPADLALTASGKLGTPRHLTSDGTVLLVGDHNPRDQSTSRGGFVWVSWPTKDDQAADFFYGSDHWPRGTALGNGRFALFTGELKLWDHFPTPNELGARPTQPPGREPNAAICDSPGDYESVAFTRGRLYLSCGNGNKLVGFSRLPTSASIEPDIVVGAPDLATNTLAEQPFITNGIPATDGTHLVVASGFDRKLYLWTKLPDESGAQPDFIYPLENGPNDVAIHDGRLIVAGQNQVWIWDRFPENGESPDRVLRGSIGTATLRNIGGVALDDRYFYLSDAASEGQAGRLLVWEGLPTSSDEPTFEIETSQAGRLSSDGTHLVLTTTTDNETGHVKVYSIAELAATSQPTVVRAVATNLPQDALVSHGHLFIADTVNNRVLVWHAVADYLAGKAADAVLGVKEASTTSGAGGPPPLPGNGRDTLFWPGGLAFDGSYLWVGEFKFSNRLLRFSPK